MPKKPMLRPILAALAALMLGATLVLSQPALAGPKKAGKHEGGAKMRPALSRLNLTDAQKAQIKPILRAAREKIKAVRADTGLTPDARKAKARAIREETKARVAALLTPEQRAKIRAVRGSGKGKTIGAMKVKRHGVKGQR